MQFIFRKALLLVFFWFGVLGVNGQSLESYQNCCDSLKSKPVLKPIPKSIIRTVDVKDRGNISNEITVQLNDSLHCCETSVEKQEDGCYRFYDLIAQFIWPGFWLMLLFLFGGRIFSLLDHLIIRVKQGAGIKIWNFELSARDTESIDAVKHSSIKRIEDIHELKEYRQDIYDRTSNAMLVHTILKSNKSNQDYDLLIYIIPRTGYSLIGLTSVEYYFGEKWKTAYSSTDRANGFPVVTSAYGPFLCAAKLNFNNNTNAFTYRYIDFEMGNVAAQAPEEKKTVQ